jgi:secondary thiamine-phosphate synthase enzyme
MLTATIEATVRASERNGYLDVTEYLERAIKESGVTHGCAVAYCAHTTCGLIINEWESGTMEDFTRRLQHLVPDETYYAHDDFSIRTQNMHPAERRNGRAHVAQMLLGSTSQTVPVAAGEPLLGAWQRLILIELDEPKDRSLLFCVFGH